MHFPSQVHVPPLQHLHSHLQSLQLQVFFVPHEQLFFAFFSIISVVMEVKNYYYGNHRYRFIILKNFLNTNLFCCFFSCKLVATSALILTLRTYFISRFTMKKSFTLIEMAIVLLVIGVLMASTMRFGSNRIVDLKAQSLKEEFVAWYNDLYSQNLTSSFRNGQKYTSLMITFQSGVWYQIDQGPFVIDSKLSGILFRNLMIDGKSLQGVALHFVPYMIGCEFSGHVFSFQILIQENGKQYCFEIPSETCKLMETRCAD